MHLGSYTYKGLIKELRYQLNNSHMFRDYKLINEILMVLPNRGLIKLPQMCINEQIYWILLDFNFKNVLRFLENENTYVCRIKPSIDGLRSEAKKLLYEVSMINESNNQTVTLASGRFIASRCIINGVLMLNLTYYVSDFGIDYESVLSNNYDGENKYKGIIND